MPHCRRAALSGREPLHVTLRVLEGITGLRRRDLFRTIRTCIGSSHSQCFRICEFVVMGNHLHLIVEVDGKEALARGMKRLASRMARLINHRLGRRGQVFGDRYHSRVLGSPRQVRNGLVYVIQNRRHHARGNARLSFDPCSSAASFTGWSAPLPRDSAWMVEALAEAPATEPARTWLLAVGWRPLGLISLEEGPA
jgi:REP element-mobilizing transposase RayT